MADSGGSGTVRGSKASTSSRATFIASRAATTASEIDNLRNHVDAQTAILHSKVEGLRSEMKGEIAVVMATIKEVEAQRSVDFNDLKSSIDSVSGSLPTKGEMWKIVGTVVGGAVVGLSLLWAVFGAGASLTGSFAEKFVEEKTRQQMIENQQTAIDRKIDQLLERTDIDEPKGSERQRQNR